MLPARVRVQLAGEVAQVLVALCDGCGTAWCHECLGSRMGSSYVATLDSDATWYCPYCDVAVRQRFAGDVSDRVAPAVQLSVGLRVQADWQALGTYHGGMVMHVSAADEEGEAHGAGCEVASIMYDDNYWEERVPNCLIRPADASQSP
eukprot:6063711-Prymnesium_polylepis.2